MRRMARAIPRANLPARPTASADADATSADGNGTLCAQRHILEVLLNRPDLFDSIVEQIFPEDFADSRMQPIAQEVWARGLAGRLATEDLIASEAMSDSGPLLAELIELGRRRENYEQTLAGAVEFMLYCRNRQQMQRLKSPGIDDDVLRQIAQHCQKPDPGRRRPRIS
jgi:hypothetical protein